MTDLLSFDNGVGPKKKFLLAAAKILNVERRCVRDFQPIYPNNLDEPDPCVQDTYWWFMEALLPPRLAEIWSQCLTCIIQSAQHQRVKNKLSGES